MNHSFSRLITLSSCFALFCFFYGSSFVHAETKGSQEQNEYIIGPEDVLEISVWKNHDLSREVIVRPDGMISLPLIGDIRSAGLSPDELRKGIALRIKEYQENAVVSVMVKEINSYKLFILGEVMKPGAYTLKAETTLIQAIALAGGFNQYASKNNIVVVRGRSDNGKVEKLKVSFKEIVTDGNADKNPVLTAGDTIFVP